MNSKQVSSSFISNYEDYRQHFSHEKNCYMYFEFLLVVIMITIGIPFFTDESYLDMAIRSIINQTYQDWVLLLVDDGSSDGSLGIAKKYEEKDSRISVISDGENKKLPYRLNQIAQLTKTPYLARMDADDIMHPERIEKQLGIL